MQRLKEKTENGTVIHCDAPGGNDYTLCGYAYEGTCLPTEGDSGVQPVERGKINCKDCLGIIRHSKAIPSRFLAARG